MLLSSFPPCHPVTHSHLERERQISSSRPAKSELKSCSICEQITLQVKDCPCPFRKNTAQALTET